MANPDRGLESYLGAGIESTWGTAVSRTNWLRVSNLSLQRTLDIQKNPHLGTSGQTSNNQRGHFTASDQSGGGFEFPAAYDDSTVLIVAHAMGAVADAGAGPFTHTITLDTTSSELAALTLEQGKGGGKAEVFEGGTIPGFEFRIAAGEIAKIIVPGVIAETSGGLVAQGSPSFATSSFIKHNQAGQFGFNSLLWDLVSISIKVERMHAERMLLGSLNTKKPCPSDFVKVTGTLVIELGAESTYGINTAWLAGTQGDATLTFTGAGNNVLAITLQNMYVNNVSDPVSGPGVIQQTVTFTCESDGTDEGLKFVFTNANANYSDNS